MISRIRSILNRSGRFVYSTFKPGVSFGFRISYVSIVSRVICYMETGPDFDPLGRPIKLQHAPPSAEPADCGRLGCTGAYFYFFFFLHFFRKFFFTFFTVICARLFQFFFIVFWYLIINYPQKIRL